MSMDEIVYQVTRDTFEAECDTSKNSVALWEPKAVIFLAEEGYWSSHQDDVVETMTPEEFREVFKLDAPESGEKIWIATYCKWEKVDFGAE